jgi:hypothetical protein
MGGSQGAYRRDAVRFLRDLGPRRRDGRTHRLRLPCAGPHSRTDLLRHQASQIERRRVGCFRVGARRLIATAPRWRPYPAPAPIPPSTAIPPASAPLDGFVRPVRNPARRHLPTKVFVMSSISNPASPGSPTQVVAEQPVRAPLLGFIPWTAPNAPAVGSIPIGADAQIVTVPPSLVNQVGGEMNRR